MEHTELGDPEHAAALRWVRSIMKAWGRIVLVTEDVDMHAVAALACSLYSRSQDLDARALAQLEWKKDGGVSFYCALP